MIGLNLSYFVNNGLPDMLGAIQRQEVQLHAVSDTTNAIESFNRLIKRFIPNSAMSLLNFFQEKLPMLFSYIAEEIQPASFNHNMSLTNFIRDIPIHNEILLKSVKNEYTEVCKQRTNSVFESAEA